MLSEENRKQREFKFTASMAPTLMSGNDQWLQEMYERAIGERPEPEQNWAMHVGSIMEPHIIDWHQKKTGQELTERGTFVAHPTKADVSSTLDCYRPADDTVLDAKVCNSYQHIDDIIRYYTPQIIVQQRCRQTRQGALLIMHGLAEPREFPITFDESYEKTLWERIAAFQLCVATFTEPMPVKKVVPPDQHRTIILDELPREQWPNWADEMIEHFKTWDMYKDSAEQFNEANKAAKRLIPDDCKHVEWGGVCILRNRANALTVRRA